MAFGDPRFVACTGTTNAWWESRLKIMEEKIEATVLFRDEGLGFRVSFSATSIVCSGYVSPGSPRLCLCHPVVNPSIPSSALDYAN